MVEPSPASAFVMVEPNFLFQILKVALDAPAQLGVIDKVSESRVCWQCRATIKVRLSVNQDETAPCVV